MYNTIVAAGHLASDPELRQVGDSKVCKIRLCISNKRAKEPCFIDAELWNKQAETANEYLKKGRPIILQGELRNSSWEKDGKKYNKNFIAATSFQFIGGGNDSDSKPQEAKQTVTAGSVDEEIPF
tara:strand:- start:1102 stop:1476 length:375 start_codon:yes stop_codon:yes gene_type:complete